MSSFSPFEQQQQNLFLLPNSTSNDQFSAASSLNHLTSQDIINTNSSSMDHSSSTVTHTGKKRKCESPNNYAQSKYKRKELQGKKREEMTQGGGEQKNSKQEKSEAELAPTGYIFVRARRGQATDSHSLAERVRRQRISERMKLLQSIVPGCDKVSGKALVLDYVINYVQSLQNQVEFLSTMLAYVNPTIFQFGTDLDSFMLNPYDQDLSNLPSTMPRMQEYNPTNISSDKYYHILQENSATNSILFPNVLPRANTIEGLWDWEVDGQKQNIMNQSALNNGSFRSINIDSSIFPAIDDSTD